jgi:hypothetical protein
MMRNDRNHEKPPYGCYWQNLDHDRKIPSTNFVDNLVVTGRERRIFGGLMK